MNSKTYQNPSWIMAIASQRSALSKWWGKSLTQVDQFELTFNAGDQDLTLRDQVQEDLDRDAAPILLQGDQAQLEILTRLTEQYIQSLLMRSLQLVTAGGGIPDHSGVLPGQDSNDDAVEQSVVFLNDPPHWLPDSDYVHQLYLGTLQADPTQKSIQVSTSQLYDLAEILHQSLEDVQPLSEAHFARMLPERSPSWRKTAAVAAIAVGVTGGAFYLTQESALQTASESSPEVVSLNPEVQDQAPPELLVPPVGSVNQPTSLPSPQTPQAAAPNSGARSPVPQRRPNPSTTAPSRPRRSQAGQSPSSPSNTSAPKNAASKPVAKKLPPPPIAIAPSSPPVASQPTVPQPGATNNKLADTSPPTSSGSISPEEPTALSQSNSQESIAAAPAPSTPRPSGAGILAENSSGDLTQSDLSRTPKAAGSSLGESSRVSRSGQFSDAVPQRQESFSSSSADGVDRVGRQSTRTLSPKAAVENFFQAQWRGREDLTQSLDYTIMVKPNGTVQSVTPKDQLALDNYTVAPLPKLDQALTPPFAGDLPQSFEVKLLPNGTISVTPVLVP